MIKKIALNILIVFVIVFALDFTIGSTLRYFYFKETSGLHYRTTYSMDSTRADILVFGSSSANHHYVPEVFEDSLRASFYNTGRDGSGIFYQTALLKSVLSHYTPKVIILDYAGDFEKGAVAYDRMSSLLPYYRPHAEIRSILELKGPYERIKLLSEIYPFNSQILTIAIGNTALNKKRKPDNKGYVALYKEWPGKINLITTCLTIDLDSNKLNSFRDFIIYAKKSGAKVFVIFSPVFQNNNNRQEIDICNDICSYENIPFIDVSKDTLFLNHNHLFQDIGHLNHNGALIFSNLIVGKIKHEL